MREEVIKDAQGRRVGVLEIRPDGNMLLRDSQNHLLGGFNAAENVTRDRNGRRLAEGNALTSLLHVGNGRSP